MEGARACAGTLACRRCRTRVRDSVRGFGRTSSTPRGDGRHCAWAGSRSEPGTLSEESHSVESDDDGGTFVSGDTEG